MQTSARNAGGADVFSETVRTVHRPLSQALNGVADGIGDVFTGWIGAGSLMEENRRLKALELSNAAYLDQAHRYEAEIDRLRALLALPKSPGKWRLAAAVVGYFPLESRISLGVGTIQGVRKGMPVVAGAGLVGVVQNVDASTCQVLLVTSAQLKLVGMVQRDPPPVGFVKGQSPDALLFEVLDSKAVVQNGDVVMTSGFSDRIPAGIPIGRIVQIEEDLAFGSRRCRVFPAVQIGAVRGVYVLR